MVLEDLVELRRTSCFSLFYGFKGSLRSFLVQGKGQSLARGL